jgi:hypothetical protein
MIGLLIRLALGRYVGGFWLGLVLFLVGLGLTAASLLAVISVGAGTSIVFIGLIVGGLIRMVLSAPALLSSFHRAGAGASLGAQSGATPIAPLPSYFAPPAEMPPGYCWQCGGKVKPGYAICLHCGASQAAVEPGPSEAAKLSGFDASTTGVPSYTGPVPAATPWQSHQNPYQQGAYQQGAYQQDPYQQDPYQQDPYQQDPYQQGAYQQGGGRSGGRPPGEQQGGRNAPRGGPPRPGQGRR